MDERFDVGEELGRAAEAVRRRFETQKRVLSFAEYLALVGEHPQRHTRDAARYLRDAVDFFGSYEIARPWGTMRRWKIFDLPFAEQDVAPARRNDRLAGQEELQNDVWRALGAFRREGRANRLLLLHGPNGSSKSTFAACLMAGLEAYSQTDEGALYRFSWVFPRGEAGKGIGFNTGAEGPGPGDTYAHLPEERIDSKLTSELREHPLLLLPRDERRVLLEKLRAQDVGAAPDQLWNGDLGHKNRQIFEALLTAYRGEIGRVFAHVQVERFYVSRKYRQGAVTIGPQMAVDARERQITSDRSLGSLPASLSALTLFETFGELVDGAGGVIEYSDLLKRPLDAWKYLLLAIESGEVALPFSNLPLNSVLIASSNELHLRAFQEHHDYHSFRGRLLRLRVPYLRDHTQEQGIYDAQIVPQIRGHVAPHATYAAALWAVLTRLVRADPAHYEDPQLGRLAADLSPLEKADLYAKGTVPRRFDGDDEKVLSEGIPAIYGETSNQNVYEGLMGASPREVRAILLEAADDGEGLGTVALLDRLEAFCRRDDYEFLRRDPDQGYYDAPELVVMVRERWLDLVDDELRGATGLIDETQYLDLFDRYVNHVSHAMKHEQLYNAVTGAYQDPDEKLMDRVETMLGASSPAAFRRDLLSAVATWAIDHPGESVDYVRLFPRYIDLLEGGYFEQQKKNIATIARDVLRLIDESEDTLEDREAAERTLALLRERHGYRETSARAALGALLDARYADV